MTRPVFIYGAGGHARELAWLIDSSRDAQFSVLGFIDDLSPEPPNWPDPRPVMTYAATREMSADAGVIIGVGSPAVRRRIANQLTEDNVDVPTLVHSSVSVSERVSLGEGCVICNGCLLTVDIQLGAHVHINLNCTVGHDVTIGDFTTLSPGVHIAGNVAIGADVFIGIGASVINGSPDSPLVIGDGCIVAAGACVTSSIEPGSMCAGVPAVVKKLVSTGTD